MSPLEPGKTLAQYKILGPLGVGGMGEVYRARDTRLGREVAIKILPAAFTDDPARLERFEREARAVAALSHPNILAIHDYGHTDDGIVYAVSELLEGRTLRDELDGKNLSQRRTIDLAVQVAEGLAAAHERGVVHRDLKPENLWVTRDGRVKILDFGLARIADRPRDEPDQGAATATAATIPTGPGMVLGTVGYMSPEQVRGVEADPRADIFSLGVVLYEMLTGRRAFDADTAVESMSSILKDDPPDLNSLVDGLSPQLESIVRHCIEKSPDERFQSARDLSFSLRSLSGGSISGLGEAAALGVGSKAARRPSVGWAALLLVAGLAAGGLAGWLALRSVATPEPYTFQPLTYRQGLVWNGRFAPDGQTVLYEAAWEGGPLEVYTTRVGTPGSQPVGLGPAGLLAVSSTGELAVSLGRQFTNGWETTGTLARVPPGGGAPREVLVGVHEADFSPDGDQLAVVRQTEGRMRLEYPIGKVIYESEGWMSRLRVSPDGKHVAFVEHPLRGDNVGDVTLIDIEGNVVARTGGGSWGIVWNADSRGVTFGNGGPVMTLDLGGRVRLVQAFHTGLAMLDRAADGTVLVSGSEARREIMGQAPGASAERNLSWFDWSTLNLLSEDGSAVVFSEGNMAGPDGYWIFMRTTDGAAPVRLENGLSLALSPGLDRVVIVRDPFGDAEINLIPTGAGEARVVPSGGLRPQPWGAWVPGRDAFVMAATAPGGTTRLYLQSVSGTGGPQPVTPDGVDFFHDSVAVSPDGNQLVAAMADGTLRVFPIDGGDSRQVPGTLPGDLPVQWSDDGRRLYIFAPAAVPTPVHTVDIETGERRLWRELAPADAAGVIGIDKLAISRDGRAYAYSFRRILSRLSVMTGL